MKRERIGPKIKKLRKSRALTQKQLAETLGYSDKSMITHIEKGDSDMTYEKILLLLRTFSLDANDLFEVQHIDKLLEENELEKRKKRKVIVYIHGLHGSKEEVKDYDFLKDEYDVVGLDYSDGNPWELKEHIANEFKKLSQGYKEIIVIANSIGAFYAYEYLSEFNIKKAFFISPIAEMHQIIFNLMMFNHVSEQKLEEEKFIKLDDGTTLSYDFYKSLENHKDNWNIPTEILYGENDDIVFIENIAAFLADHPQSKLTIKKGGKHYFHTIEDKKYIKDWILNNI